MTRFLVMPDELVYSKAAAQIWHSPPLVGHGSDWFVSWSQLLPLVDAIPLGALHDLAAGVRIAHLVGAAAMALTAVPSYLLAREVTGDRPAGYLVAALSVSVPWMAMSGALMTEVVAYPAFTWAAFAATRACTRPSPRNDALAVVASLVAVFARAQLVFVPVVLVGVVGASALRARRPLRVHRLLALVTALIGGGIVIAIIATGGSSTLLGSYSSLASAHSASSAIAGRVVAYVAIAVGGAPLVIGLPWLIARLVRPERPGEFAFAVFACASMAVLVFQASLELSQPGRVQDRYLLYALPLLFTAMAAALLSARRLAVGTAVVGVLLAALVSRFDFVESGAELTSLSFTLHRPTNQLAFSAGDALGIADLSPGWFLAVLVVLLSALLALAMRGVPGRRRLCVVGLCVLLFCAAETVDAFTQVRQSAYGPGYLEPKPRNWIDQIVPPGARVGLIVTQAGDPLTTPLQWWGAGFWNRTVDRFYVPDKPGLSHWGQPSVHTLPVDAVGRPRDGREWWVVSTDDPEVRVRGGDVVAQAGPLQLRRVTPAAPLRITG
jgi:hypothetical protein